MNPTLWAFTAFFTYMAVSLLVGDTFPFSRYSMYAKLRNRVEGAVFAVRVAGQLVPVGELERFVGVDPAKVDPEGYPCSQQWVVYEARRWIEANGAAEADDTSVEVEVGFRILRLERFVLQERWAPLTSGRAHRRSR